MEKLSQYAGEMDLLLVPFTRIQLEISRCCPESLSTVIMRRFMMRISTLLAENWGAAR